MFSQPPEDEYNDSKKFQINPHSRRIKSHKKKNKRKGKKKKASNISRPPLQLHFSAHTMSSWAESFTHAATWQLKHQVAYWKSKATALEYENRLLHEIIRKNYINGSQSDENVRHATEEANVSENTMESESEDEEEQEGEDFEVSEEFIQFLMNNKKYKDDAKRERERLKALNNAEHDLIKEMEAPPTKSPEDSEKVLQDLYGDKWQKISALETSIQSQFLSNCDQEKPEYWPNIPLNFNFS